MDWIDDQAATPVSDVKLTPPSLGFGAGSVGADAVGSQEGALQSGLGAPPGHAGIEPAAEAPAQGGTLEELFAALDAAKHADAAKPRRGRPPKVLALLSRAAADSVDGPVEELPASAEAGLDVPVGVVAQAPAALEPRDVFVGDVGGMQLSGTPGPESCMHLAVRGGYAIPSSLPGAIVQRMHRLREAPRAINADVRNLCVGKVRKGGHIGMMLGSELRGLDYRTFRSSLHRWSCGLLCFITRMRMLLEMACVNVWRDRVAHYLEWQRYDETPLPMRTQDAFHKLCDAPDEDATAVSCIGDGNLQLTMLGTSGAAKKLMQTEQQFSVVLTDVKFKFICLLFDFPGPLTVMENAKAKTMLNILARTVGTTLFAAQSKSKSRLACADGHPSNKCAENQLSGARPGWPSYLFWCELHLVALILTSVFAALAADVVRGILYIQPCV